jgi:hypothetical protein
MAALKGKHLRHARFLGEHGKLFVGNLNRHCLISSVIGHSRNKSCTAATITTTLSELCALCDFDSEIFHGFESSTKK